MQPTETLLPTRCPYCLKLIVGEVRSFCKHCREVFDECDSKWRSTDEPVMITFMT
jgi:hypothetical protein